MPLNIRSKVREITRARATLARPRAVPKPLPLADDASTGIVCHCRKVEYDRVRTAIADGARTISDLQRATTACTRCFGCRSELERILKLHLGDAFRHQATVTLPPEFAKQRPIRPMYMPVLVGFRGSPVDTRVIVFNWEGPDEPVTFRADLLTLGGERVEVWNHSVENGSSAVIELSRELVGDRLPEGIGVVKLLLDTPEVGSLRPYFHFSTPTCVTTTHEKKGPPDPNRRIDRRYHWIFPIGVGDRNEEAYLFATNTQMEPMKGRLEWTADGGKTKRERFGPVEFDQTLCAPLHEYFPAIATGVEGGSVRLSPATHAVAGFMFRHDPERQLWRVQHL